MTLVARPRLRPLLFVFSLMCLVACVAGCVIAVVSTASNGRPAGARHDVREGLGRMLGGDFVGFFVAGHGTKVYCLSPRSRTPRTISLRTVAHYPGISHASGAALAYALAQWGDATSRDAAVVESQVLNTLAGHGDDVARRAASLPHSLRHLTAVRVEQARAMRGPYRVTAKTASSPLPGGSTTLTVSVRSAAGHVVPGARVAIRSSSNATVSTSARTDRHGTALARVVVTGIGEVRLSATVSGLPATEVRISDPHRGEQRLATAGGAGTARAATSFRATVSGFSHRYGCSSECDGHPRVSLTACAPALPAPSRIVYRLGDRDATVAFAASSRKVCRSLDVVLADRTVVTAAWQFHTTRGWTEPMPARGSFVVDCPPAPPVEVTMRYNCTSAQVSAEVIAPRGRTVLLEVSGDRQAQTTSADGRRAVWAASLGCGARLHLTVRAAVRRTGGGWNYGLPVAVTTP